jgi:hypothetical protein
MNCENCNGEIDHLCSNCLAQKELKRIDYQFIKNEILGALNFERGIFYTIRELMLRPGKSVKEFLHHDRTKLVKPVFFLMVMSFTYAFIENFLPFKEEMKKPDFDSSINDSSINNLIQIMNQNIAYLYLLISFFLAWWAKVFFKKSDYNYYEILLFILYNSGLTLFIYAITGIILLLMGVTEMSIFTLVTTCLFFVYIIWSAGQFFDGNKIVVYIKFFISYLLGFISFIIMLAAIAITIDLLMGKF